MTMRVINATNVDYITSHVMAFDRSVPPRLPLFLGVFAVAFGYGWALKIVASWVLTGFSGRRTRSDYRDSREPVHSPHRAQRAGQPSRSGARTA